MDNGTRPDLDSMITTALRAVDELKSYEEYSLTLRELALVKTKLEEARLWFREADSLKVFNNTK